MSLDRYNNALKSEKLGPHGKGVLSQIMLLSFGLKEKNSHKQQNFQQINFLRYEGSTLIISTLQELVQNQQILRTDVD